MLQRRAGCITYISAGAFVVYYLLIFPLKKNCLNNLRAYYHNRRKKDNLKKILVILLQTRNYAIKFFSFN